jgi:hypothetical protein
MATFRNTAWNVSPARLRTSTALRMVYAFIGIPLDTIAEATYQATIARFPELAPEDALSAIGRDRGIIRGPLEPAESYRARLLLWTTAWRGAGVGQAMLDQIAGYLTPQPVRLRIWTQTGVIYTRELDGTLTIERAGPGVWNWDNQPDLWARFWLIIYSVDGVPWERDGTWDGAELWGGSPLGAWGCTGSYSDMQSIRGIVDERKPAASLCQSIIVAFDNDVFDPADASPPLPDGTWGSYWDCPSLAANRDARAIYGKGV